MRKSLAWTLGITLVLSGIALWLPREDAVPGAAPVRPWVAPDELARVAAEQPSRPSPLVAPLGTLPSVWPIVTLEPAKRDVFAPVLPPAPPVPPAPKVVAAPPPPFEPPAPMAPPMNYRYVGQMRAPDGTLSLYLSRGVDAPVPVAIGDRLGDGYVVESVSDEGVQLVYPPLGVKASVNIPPAQR